MPDQRMKDNGKPKISIGRIEVYDNGGDGVRVDGDVDFEAQTLRAARNGGEGFRHTSGAADGVIKKVVVGVVIGVLVLVVQYAFFQ